MITGIRAEREKQAEEDLTMSLIFSHMYFKGVKMFHKQLIQISMNHYRNKLKSLLRQVSLPPGLSTGLGPSRHSLDLEGSL